jgi:hypothetical protein
MLLLAIQQVDKPMDDIMLQDEILAAMLVLSQIEA